MYKEEPEQEKFSGHKYREHLIKKIDEALRENGLIEEDYEEIRKILRGTSSKL